MQGDVSPITLYTVPMTPDATNSRTLTLKGKNRVQTASIRNKFLLRAHLTRVLACEAVTVKAFSQRTGFPASSASIAF